MPSQKPAPSAYLAARFGRSQPDEEEPPRYTIRAAPGMQADLLAWWQRVRGMVLRKESLADHTTATVCGGLDNAALADFTSISGGMGAKAYLWGQTAYAAGGFGGTGSAQASTLLLRRAFTSGAVASPVELFLDGASRRWVLENQTIYAFEILLAGWHETKGAQVAYAWRIQGLARRGATAANTTLVASGVSSLGADAGAPAAPFVQADTTNGALGLWAYTTGSLGDAQYFVARASLVEVAS